MELTPDEKKRIEEEEHKRLAEEQYRAQVRARLSEPSTTETTSLEPVEPTSNRTGWPKGRLLTLSCLLVGTLWFTGTHYIIVAKNDVAILRKAKVQVFPLTLDVSHWTISDVIQNPDTVLLFAQQ